MTQIYVIVNQRNPLIEGSGIPILAFSDYPSALTYAQSIFKPVLGSKMSARDLIFLVNLTPTPTSTASATIPTSTLATLPKFGA
jgi:hypothetical protein